MHKLKRNIREYVRRATGVFVALMVAGSGLFAVAIPAFADVSPASCLNNDFVVNLNKSTAIAYDETNPNGPTTITYSVDAGNPQDGAGKGCDVDNVTITVTDPHGTVHTVQTAGSYPIGTAVTALPTTVSYVTASGDVSAGKLTASVHAVGALHDTPNGTDPLDVSKTVSVTVISPNTTVGITTSASAVVAGGTVNLTITEHNTGNDPITSPSVTLTPPGTVLSTTSPTFSGGDTNGNGILDTTETWSWLVTGVTISSATTYTVVGDGLDTLNNHVTFGAYPNEKATTDVKVVDANIQISPLQDTDPINDSHVLTGHVNIDSGSGFVNAPDGTVINFSIVSGPGNLLTPSCTTTGATGSCTDTLTSAVAGTTVVNASTSVVVSGVTLSRSTNGTGANSGPANKVWVKTSLTTTASQAVSIGGNIHDTAHLADGVNPTGTISFQFFAPGDTTCANAINPNPTSATVNGNGDYNSGDVVATQAGTYRFKAHYSGDVSNSPADTACNDANESVVIAPNQPTIATILSTTTVNVNTPVHDTAQLTGATANAGGTVTYNVYSGSACIGTPVFTDTKSVTNGVVADSANFTPTVAGTYNWQAVYSGDANNAGATSQCQTEVLTVRQPPAQPVLTTTASSAVPLGGSIHDTAHLSGGTNPTGTITFQVFGPNDATCSNAINPAPTSATVNGNGDYSSGNVTVNSVGTYRFVAHYSGDAANLPANTACNDANESVVIAPNQPTIATNLSATTVNINTPVHDSATLTGVTANAGGTVTYNVYSGNVCTGSTVFSNTQTVTNGVVPNSSDFTPTTAGTYNWQAVYSGDANNLSATSTCQTETLAVNQPAVPTRTLGFWQTHTAFSESIFHGAPLNGTFNLGGMVINTDGKLFGGFYSSIPKTTAGAKRSSVDQARMQLAQQYIAAVLNCAAFTCPANITTLLAQASTDFSSGTASQILADASALDAYNNSGDSISTSLSAGSATPGDSKATATLTFWDVLN